MGLLPRAPRWNSYYPGRAWGPLSRWGVEVRFGEGDLVSFPTGTNHESTYWYDRHVAMIFMGAAVVPGTWDAPVYTVDFAPTLAGLAGIPIPDDLDGRRLRAQTARVARVAPPVNALDGAESAVAVEGAERESSTSSAVPLPSARLVQRSDPPARFDTNVGMDGCTPRPLQLADRYNASVFISQVWLAPAYTDSISSLPSADRPLLSPGDEPAGVCRHPLCNSQQPRETRGHIRTVMVGLSGLHGVLDRGDRFGSVRRTLL